MHGRGKLEKPSCIYGSCADIRKEKIVSAWITPEVLARFVWNKFCLKELQPSVHSMHCFQSLCYSLQCILCTASSHSFRNWVWKARQVLIRWGVKQLTWWLVKTTYMVTSPSLQLLSFLSGIILSWVLRLHLSKMVRLSRKGKPVVQETCLEEESLQAFPKYLQHCSSWNYYWCFTVLPDKDWARYY